MDNPICANPIWVELTEAAQDKRRKTHGSLEGCHERWELLKGLLVMLLCYLCIITCQEPHMSAIGNTVAELPCYVRPGRASIPSPALHQATGACIVQQQEEQAYALSLDRGSQDAWLQEIMGFRPSKGRPRPPGVHCYVALSTGCRGAARGLQGRASCKRQHNIKRDKVGYAADRRNPRPQSRVEQGQFCW